MSRSDNVLSNCADASPRPNKLAARLLIGGFSAALMVLGSGCATQYVHQRHEAQFLPDPVDSSIPVACHLVIPQDDPFVAAKRTSPWQVPYDFNNGLVGLALEIVMNEALHGVNSTANEVRKEEAMKRSAPLRGHGVGDWFTNNVDSSFSAALNSSVWLRALPLEMRRDNQEVTEAELNQQPILDVRLIYNLSFDASRLVMQARLFYFKQGETNTEHVCYYTYFSKPVGPEENEAAVAKWVSNDNQLLRQRMSEGLNQIIEMINMDFLRPEWRDPTIPSVSVSFWDALSEMRVQFKGHILSKTNSRIIFQTESEKGSNLYSIIPE